MNYIKSILLNANRDILIELNDHVNILYGYSSSGKTLLFKLIEFVLGKEEIIDIDEAKKKIHGLNYVEIKFSQCQVLRRYLNTNFEGAFGIDKCSTITNDKAQYRKFVGDLFHHKDIKVIKKPSTYTTTTLSVAEFINNFFFGESKIGESKPFYQLEGKAAEIKLKNYFKYFITGEVVPNSDIKQKKEELALAQKKKKAESFFSSYKKLVKKPSKKDLIRLEQLPSLIEISKNNIDKINKEQSSLQNKLFECKIMLDKFVSLKELYKSQIEDLKCSSAIDTFMTDAWIECENCGNKIYWKQNTSVDDEIACLNSKIIDLNHLEIIKQNELKEHLNKLNDLIKEQNNEKNNIKLLEDELGRLISTNEEFINYQNAYSDYFNKEKYINTQKDEIDPNSKIDIDFAKQIDILCSKISNRLQSWGLPEYTNVSFDHEKFDFKFDGTLRYILAKGFKSFCTTAMIIELIYNMKEVGVSCFDFVLVDTIWQISDFQKINIMDVAKKYINDIAQLNLQVIIFENKIPDVNNANCKLINMNNL